MAHDVRYCTTEDGVRIAYAVSGKGERWLVHTSLGLSAMLQFESIPGRQAWNEGLEEHFRLLQYDSRGTGFSQRDVEDLSHEALVRDLESVVDAAGVDQAAVYGFLVGTYTAVWYAAAHPERVSHLALWLPPWLPEADTPQIRAFAELAASDWENFTELYAHQAFGWDRGEQANAYARLIRETITQETFLRYFRRWFRRWGTGGFDELYEPASRVRVPTLCMQRQDYDAFHRFAAPIAGATTRMFPGKGMVPYLDGGHDVVQAIADFAGAAGSRRSDASDRQTGVDSTAAMAVILFTDIVDSTALTERLGDAVFRMASRTLDEGMRVAMEEAGGTPVDGKVLGDGVMAVFSSASQAIAAARRCIELSTESELQLHVGVHAGDVIREKDNVYGGAVNIASRICGLSAPGEVLVSATVRELARTSAGVTFAERGEHALKGIDDAVRLYEVRWRE
jgi:class 3 adenylate cyclase/pimeloyl-ACP methyl ester carboxylesterase